MKQTLMAQTSALLGAGPRRIGIAFGLIFLAQIVWAVLRVPGGGLPTADAALAEAVSSVRQIGIELFTTHAFAFEVTSVLILAAMVGAVALAKRNL